VEEKDKRSISGLLILYNHSIKSLLSTLWIKIIYNADTSCAAERFYKLLLRWGRFSGLSHPVSETPEEYGIRLGRQFLQLEKEIRLIIHVHDEAISDIFRQNRKRATSGDL